MTARDHINNLPEPYRSLAFKRYERMFGSRRAEYELEQTWRSYSTVYYTIIGHRGPQEEWNFWEKVTHAFGQNRNSLNLQYPFVYVPAPYPGLTIEMVKELKS